MAGSVVTEKRFVWKFIDEVTQGVNKAKSAMKEAEASIKGTSTGITESSNSWKKFGANAKEAADKSEQALQKNKESLENYRDKAVAATKSVTSSLNLYSDKLKGIPSHKFTNVEAKVKDEKIKTLMRKLQDIPKEKSITAYLKDAVSNRLEYLKLKLRELPKQKSVWLRIKDGFSSEFRKAQNQANNTKRSFSSLKTVMTGTFLGGAILNGIYSITNGIKNMAAAGMQFDTEQQKMLATWKTLTGSAGQAKSMVDTINDLSIKTGQATDTINELEQGFYHLHSSKSEADEMTKAMLNMGDAVGLSGQQLTQVEQDMVHGLATGKVTQGELNQIGMYFPMIDERMAKHFHTTVAGMRKMASAGKITGKDLEEVFEQMGNSGKYKHAVENMMQTTWGAFRTIGSMAPRLVGALEKGLFSARNPLVNAIAKWTTDPATKRGFTNFGKGMAEAFNTVSALVTALLKPFAALAKEAAKIVKPFSSGVWLGMKTVFAGIADGANALSAALSKVFTWLGKVFSKFGNATGLSHVFKLGTSAAKTFGAIVGGLLAPITIVVGAVKTYNAVIKTFAVVSKIAGAAAKLFATDNKLLSLSFLMNPIFLFVAAIVAIGAAIYEAYKHCKPFRNAINGIAKEIVKLAKTAKTKFGQIKKWISDSFTGKAGWEKDLKKNFSKMMKEYERNAKQRANLEKKQQQQEQKQWQKHWKNLQKGSSKLWNSFVNNARKGMRNIQKEHDKWSKNFQKGWNRTWTNVSRFANRTWQTLRKNTSRSMGSMHASISVGMSKISNVWNSMWSGLRDVFKNIWDTIKQIAQDGMNAVISVINGGISAIDKVWSFFTGHGSGIGKLKKVHFATGGTVGHALSVVNDGPGDNWKELMQFPDGSFGMSQKRNATLMLPVGTRVYSGPETKAIMSMAGVEHYATGGVVGAQHFAGGGIVRALEGFIAKIGDAIGGIGERFAGMEDYLEAPVAKVKSVIQRAVGGNYSALGHWGELAHGEWNKITDGMKHWVQHTITQFLYSFENQSLSKDMMRSAATINKLKPSDGFFGMLWQVIMSESGGRNILQQIHDVNSGGNEAGGILQFTPGTFAKYALPGHGERMNDFNQLLAFFNNTDWLNSIGSTIIRGVQKIDWLHSGPQGGARNNFWPKLATGGEVFNEIPAIIGDNAEHHEFVINPYAPSAKPLLAKAYEATESAQGGNTTPTNNGNSKLDQVVDLLAQLVALVGDIDPEVILSGDVITKYVNKKNAKLLSRVKG